MSKQKKKIRRKVSSGSPNDKDAHELNKRMDAILRKIPKGYQREDFKYFSLVGSALEHKSVNSMLKQFVGMDHQLSKCLNRVVDQNYQGFFQTVTNFSDILSNLKVSRDHISNLVTSISECERLLTLDHESITSLFSKYKQNKKYISILEEIEDMMKIPKKINEGIQSKHYLYTVDLINEYIDKMKQKKFRKIRGVDAIRKALKEATDSIPEKLFDELSEFCYHGEEINEPKKKHVKKKIPNFIKASRRHRQSRRNLVGSPSPLTPSISPVQMEAVRRSSESRRYSIVKDDLNTTIVPNTHKYIEMLVKSVIELRIIRQARNRLNQSLHMKFSELVDGHIQKFLKNFENSEICYKIYNHKKNLKKKKSNFSTFKQNNVNQKILEIIYLQKDELLKLFKVVFKSLLRVLKNFKYLIRTMNEFEKYSKQKRSMQKKLEKEHEGYRGKKVAKPSDESQLKQKLTKENLLKLREGIRLELDKIRSSKANEYINSLDDILVNFIEKEIQNNEDISKMEVTVLNEIFKDKIKSELQMTGSGGNINREEKKYCSEFRSLILRSLSSAKTPNTLPVLDIWRTVQNVVKQKLLNEILNISTVKQVKREVITSNTDLLFLFNENNTIEKSRKSKQSSSSSSNTSSESYSFSKFFVPSLYNMIWISKPLLQFIDDAKSIITISDIKQLEDINLFNDSNLTEMKVIGAPIIEQKKKYKKRRKKKKIEMDYLTRIIPRENESKSEIRETKYFGKKDNTHELLKRAKNNVDDNDDFVSANKKYEDLLLLYKRKMQSMNKQLSSYMRDNTQLERDCLSLRKENNELKIENSDLKMEKEQIIEENIKLRKKIIIIKRIKGFNNVKKDDKIDKDVLEANNRTKFLILQQENKNLKKEMRVMKKIGDINKLKSSKFLSIENKKGYKGDNKLQDEIMLLKKKINGLENNDSSLSKEIKEIKNILRGSKDFDKREVKELSRKRRSYKEESKYNDNVYFIPRRKKRILKEKPHYNVKELHFKEKYRKLLGKFSKVRRENQKKIGDLKKRISKLRQDRIRAQKKIFR